MTKKDYIAIAGAINEAYRVAESDDERRGIVYTTDEIAAVLYRDNNRFDRERFTTACYKGLVSARAGSKPRPI